MVKAHGAGLFSNINKVLVCMRIYDHVHVDWAVCGPNDPAFKHGQSFYGDCWNALFEPTTPPPNKYETVYSYPFYDITGGCAGVLYQNEQWGWRETYHAAWEKLRCKVEPVPVREGSVGVLIRSDVLGGEQLSGRSQPLEEYEAAIKKTGAKNVFVVSSDMESILWIGQRFSHLTFNGGIKRNQKRSDPEQHVLFPQGSEDAVKVMKEVLMLATCKYLVHPVSNMATAALYINPNLESIYLK